MVASMSTGLLCLSAFPHQEPRFLSPMLLPAVFLFARHTKRLSSAFWVIKLHGGLTEGGPRLTVVDLTNSILDHLDNIQSSFGYCVWTGSSGTCRWCCQTAPEFHLLLKRLMALS